ncbi:MAG: DUF1566 domain-containing protein [Saprospiraceae bacterium]|nr:DUF1566 domain-containing protein [Saprospiraceae bacterium]
MYLFSQNVGINTIPHPNASLDVSGINKGLLIPRGDAGTRNSLNLNTAKGLMMYDTTTSTIWVHNGNGNGSGWQSLSNGPNHWKLSGALGTEITNTNPDGFWSAYASTVLSDPGLISPPVSGPGTRLMWIPQKSAFRVGSTDAGHWDAENIGLFSFAGGLNTTASNPYSFAMGAGTSSKGLASTSLGWFTSATGHSSVAAGFRTRAKSYSSFAIGRWNDSIAISNNTTWIHSDPIFMIGNGTSENARHNAMVVYKNGNMVLKNPMPFYINKLPVEYEIPIEGEGTRMMWLPELGAFRVGSAIDSAWNADKIGFGSFATGINATASGFNTLAAGLDTKASGSTSAAFGIANITRGYSSLAIGMFNDPILMDDQDEFPAPESPLFIIGNGDDYDDRHNAMIVQKDGHVGIGTNTPPTNLTVIGPAGNPSIPGTASTGIFRVGLNEAEGMDIGKMTEPPFSGWVQVGINGALADPLSLQPSGGEVGIGTYEPVTPLTIIGSAGNPSIPNTTSNGIVRIGLNGSEGIDIGKMDSGNFAGWIQVGIDGELADPLSLQPLGGKVGIGTTSPASSAILDVTSTNKGFLPPRMSYANRISIASPEAGLIIWCTDCGILGQLQVYNGSFWSNMLGHPAVNIISVGMLDGGGIVAYIFQPGDPGYVAGEQHGLVVTETNVSESTGWGCNGSNIPGAEGILLGTGPQNTTDIVSGCGEGGTAARLCYELALNGFNDWYLPSKDELNILYTNRLIIGGFNDGYWSSSESSSTTAWFRDFTTGAQAAQSKNFFYTVRAVRTF